MAAADDKEYIAYPVFKGLQKPLEFMGVQGRYIYWAAAAAGGAIIGFILGYWYDNPCWLPRYWSGSDNDETEERTSHKERV